MAQPLLKHFHEKDFLVHFFLPPLFALSSSCHPLDTSSLAEFRRDGFTGRHLEGSKKVALTFDDGPTEFTAALGDYLISEQVPATFFINGAYLGDFDEILESLASRGIDLGNHGHHHQALVDDMPSQTVKDEILATDAIIKRLAPHENEVYLRPPFGIWTERDAEILSSVPELGHYRAPVLWTVGGDSLILDDQIVGAADWECWRDQRTPLECFIGYRNDLERAAGGIVLLHLTDERTISLTEMLVSYFRSDGYEFISLKTALTEQP